MNTNPSAVTESQNKQDETLERRLAAHIATQAFQLLVRSNMLRDEHSDAPLIYAWSRADRVILIVDPLRLKNIDGVISRRFRHHLGTLLQGRRVVVTNHRGVFVQIGYWPEPMRPLMGRDLDLSAQPTPLHVPIGNMAQGDLWLSIAEMDAVLIGGARRMGKTNLLHSWIQSLLHGGEVRLILFDGKSNAEFSPYLNQPRCQVIGEGLAKALADLSSEMNQRLDLFKSVGVANLSDFNKGKGEGAQLERVVLIIDELAYALQIPGVLELLVDITARGGGAGIHPIVATQRPDRATVAMRLKANLVTRIAFPVPARADSVVVLDRSGAERLPKTPGRLLLLFKAQVIEAQTFRLSTEIPTPAAVPPANCRLSERERRLAEAANARGGWFRIKEITADTGESQRFVNDTATRWEQLGWVTKVERDEHSGRPLGRRMTQALSKLLEC